MVNKKIINLFLKDLLIKKQINIIKQA